MTQTTKLPIKTEKTDTTSARVPTAQSWTPFATLRSEIDRLFDDFGHGFWRSPFKALSDVDPFRSAKLLTAAAPASDVVESEKAYEITAEMPGIDEKNIEVKIANGGLTIKGEKKEEKEQKEKDYYVSERHYGSFERYFRVPDGVDTDKIEANLKNGVLTVTLPKKLEAQQPAKKVEVKAAA